MSVSPRISVIIPIYNVEDYLEECLNSILSQTLGSIEVICVNDGSTDSSLQILRHYEALDSRIVIIDKENGGYGKAVNRGLEQAVGEWISIIEPDDFIDSRMYEDLISESVLSNGNIADVVKSGYWLYFDLDDNEASYVQKPNLINCMHPYRYEFNVKDDPEVLRHHPSIWSALYKRSFIEKHHIRMIEPKGAGWADNPWFFRTMLLAERIVWTPVPYYRYRQTNPNASSVLRDYHLPFDRLRDIRAIYEELGIDDRGLLTVLYQRIFNYIGDTLLTEFRFPEADPEMKKLIIEAIEWMDPEIVLTPRNGISNSHKSYYRDVMGYKLNKIKHRNRNEMPFFSVILPFKDDRVNIWNTIEKLKRQRRADFEVILVDCGTNDRTTEIVESVTNIDQRFRSVNQTAKDIATGFNLGIAESHGEYILFARSGVIFESRDYFRKLKKIAKHASPDILVTEPTLPRFKQDRHDADGDILLSYSNLDDTGFIASNLDPNVYRKVFKKNFLSDNQLLFQGPGDEDGHAFNVIAMSLAKDITLVDGLEINFEPREDICYSFLDDEQDLIQLLNDRYAAMYDRAASESATNALNITRGCIIHDMAKMLRCRGLKSSGDEFFYALKDIFYNKFDLQNNYSKYSNYYDYTSLEEAFTTSYERYRSLEEQKQFHLVRGLNSRIRTLSRKNRLLTEEINRLESEVEELENSISKIKNSKRYKLGSIAATAYRAVNKRK